MFVAAALSLPNIALFIDWKGIFGLWAQNLVY